MASYIDPKTVKLSDLVKGGKKVRFSYFRDGEFWYEQEDGFLFPISLVEATAGKATFLAEDKALYFMRWMKKYIDSFKQEDIKDKNSCVVFAPKADDLQEGFTPQ